MPETTPLIERIVLDLVTALEAIVEGDSVTDIFGTTMDPFQISVGEVIRPKRIGLDYAPTQDYSIVVLQGGSAPEPDSDSVAGAARRQSVSLDLYAQISDMATTAVDTKINLFAAEVVKAIMADPQRSGLAYNSEIGEFQYIDGGDAIQGVTIMYDVIHRTPEADPYTKA